MGSSKTVLAGLALSLLQLFDTSSYSYGVSAPKNISYSSHPASSLTTLKNPPKTPQNDDDKYVEEFIRQNRLHELAEMHKTTEQTQQPPNNDQPSLSVLQNYTKLSAGTLAFIEQESAKDGIPLSIVLGLMEQESSFHPDATNPVTGAVGLGQLEQPTAVELASRDGLDVGSLHDPISNARLTISYLNYLHHQTSDWNATLTAYNRGLGGLQAYQRENGTSISDYSSGVMQKAHHIDTVLNTQEVLK